MTRPFVLDMETSDPDDYLTLLLLLGHPQVDLRAVTVTPGTRDQVGLVRSTLRMFERSDVTVGAFDIDHPKDCGSAWHRDALNRWQPADADAEGWEVLRDTLRPDTTLVTGAALKNLGRLLEHTTHEAGALGRGFIQGGFAGEGVVPSERQLEKFRGKVTQPSFNLNGAPAAALAVLQQCARFSDLRFVSKNVCHGVLYDADMHARFAEKRLTWCTGHYVCRCECHQPGAQVMHVMACCSTCDVCGQEVADYGNMPRDRTALAQSLIFRSMRHYLSRHPKGKALHDPLAAACAIDPEIGEWAEVELYRERGEWGAFALEGSGVRIITGYDHERFVRTLLED